MSYRFKLEVPEVRCQISEMFEWGKDEVRLFGFGITRRGRLFATGYRNLGSYDEGEIKTTGEIPQTLFDGEIEDDETDVLIFFWGIEEDGDGVRDSAAALEAEFRASYLDHATQLTELQFPRACIPFHAFFKAGFHFDARIKAAAEGGFPGRTDEVSKPFEYLFRRDTEGAFEGSLQLPSQIYWSPTGGGGRMGLYTIILRYTYSRIFIGSSDV